MKILVIINGYYPYERGEDYLSDESKYIDGFDKVYVFPMFIYGKKNLTDIHDYIVGEKINFINSPNNYKCRIIRCLKFMLSRRFFWNELFRIVVYKKKRINCIKVVLRTSFKSINAYFDLCKMFQNTIGKDELFLYSYWMADTAVVVSLIKAFSRLPVQYAFSRCHRFDVYEYANPLNYLAYRSFIFSNLDEIFAISNDAKFYLETVYHSAVSGKIQISRLGTKDYGQNLNITRSKTLKVVSCSWLRPVKRVSLILDALDSLSYAIEWTHYGDGEEKNILYQRAKFLRNKNLKIFWAGKTPNYKVLESYKKIHYDVFINVSENEGVPVSIMEAMSFGIPIIATNVGGTAEIVHDGVNGYLLQKDCNIDDIVMKIDEIHDLTDIEYLQMRQASRQLWLELSSSKVNYENFYRGLNII